MELEERRGVTVEMSDSGSRNYFAALAMFGVACASAPARPPEASVAVPAAIEVEAEGMAPSDRPYRAALTCRVSDPELERPVQLKISAGGAAVATIQDGAPSLVLGKEPLVLEVEGGGVLLRTPYDPTETPLRLREAIALKGVVTPKPEASVSWLGAHPNAAQCVRYRSESFPDIDLIDEVPCASLTLRTAEFEVPVPEVEANVLLQGQISVREAIGSKPSLVFDSAAFIPAAALERKSGFVHILVDTEFEVLRGWVPESVVSRAPGVIGSIGRGYGIGGLGLRGASHIYYTRCDHELRLFAKVGSEQGEVGVIHPDTRFEIGGAEPGARPDFTQIDLWQSRIMPAEGAVFLVRSAALESGCGHPD